MISVRGRVIFGRAKAAPSIGDIYMGNKMFVKPAEHTGGGVGVIFRLDGNNCYCIGLSDIGTVAVGTNVYAEGVTTVNDQDTVSAQTSYFGVENTDALIAMFGKSYAAGICRGYSTIGTKAGDWYLPASGELYSALYLFRTEVFNSIILAGGTAPSAARYSSSTQSSRLNNGTQWCMDRSSATLYSLMDFNYKSNVNAIRPAIKIAL